MADKPDNSTQAANSVGTIAIALVFVVLSGVIGAVAKPDQAATILSSISGIAVMLVALMREQQKTHHAVNSRMDELLAATKISANAAGVAEERERERVKTENQEESNDAT